MEPTSILLADDHSIVLEGLREVLKADDELEVIGRASNGEEVLRFVRQYHPHVVILDINMPVMDGITCARHLKRDHPDVKIIILTMYSQRTFVEEIIKLGIDGCLLKSNTGKELIEAIRRVMSGKTYYDRIRSFTNRGEEVTQYKLSEREIEIIRLMSEGLTSLDIGEKLFISEHTVKTHRKNILKKLKLNNSSQVVQFALTNQII